MGINIISIVFTVVLSNKRVLLLNTVFFYFKTELY